MPTRGGSAQVTTDHELIRSWVEERGGCPAVVKSTRGHGGPGVLRIDYPGFSGMESLEEIEWDDFFTLFDQRELAFLHQDRTTDGQPTRFSKLVKRDSLAARSAQRARRPRRTAGARTASGTRRGTTGGRTRAGTGRRSTRTS